MFVAGATTPKAFIEDLASSGFCENKGLGGVLSLAGSKNLTRRLCCSISGLSHLLDYGTCIFKSRSGWVTPEVK